MTKSNCILVTGATGFVGRHLLDVLPKDRVRVAVRELRVDSGGSPEQVVVGAIDRNTNWDQALVGVDTIVHLAAHVHVMSPSNADKEQYFETNVRGTEHLARTAAARGVKRFVFLSSIKVNGEATTGAAFDPTSAATPTDDYGMSKWRAEQSIAEITRQSAMRAVIVRTPLVYGPGVRANFLRLLSWVHKGYPLPLGAVANRRSLVSVWNLCDLIRHLCEASAVESGVMMVSDGEDLSTPDLIRRLAKGMGRPARLVPVPVSMLTLMGSIVGKQAEVSRLVDSLTIDMSETTGQLGWTPPVSVDDGLARTARWFSEEVKARRG